MIKAPSTLPLFGVAWAFLAACGDITAPAPKPAPRPDVSGGWTISFSGVYPGHTSGDEGACSIGGTRVELTLAEEGYLFDRYEGTSTETHMACSGLVAAVIETTGLRDTTITFPPDNVLASSHGRLCVLFFGGCDPPFVSLRFAGLSLSASVPQDVLAVTELRGRFSWITDDTLRVQGDWRAERLGLSVD